MLTDKGVKPARQQNDSSKKNSIGRDDAEKEDMLGNDRCAAALATTG